MTRFATLGVLLASAAVGSAANPVSVHPPAGGSSLSQSLPSAIQSAVPNAPAPALMSTPNWRTESVIGSTQAIPTTGPVGCATCDTPAVRPHFNLLDRPGWLCAATACGGCGVRGSCFERLKAWLCHQSCAVGPPLTPTPYRVPLRAYFPCTPDAGRGSAGCVGGGCGPVARPNVFARIGLFGNAGVCEATIPTTPLPTATGCDSGCRTRVTYAPAGGACADGSCGAPSLMGRLASKLTGGSCGTGCWAGNCPPPPPSPVRYASPCTPPQYGSMSTQPVHVQPTAQPAANGKAVPAPMPTTGPKTGAAVSATRPFTNP